MSGLSVLQNAKICYTFCYILAVWAQKEASDPICKSLTYEGLHWWAILDSNQ